MVVYLEIVLRRSLLYKDLQRNITSIFKKEKKLPFLVHPALVLSYMWSIKGNGKIVVVRQITL